MPTDIGPRIGIDGESEFKNSLKAISAQLKTMGSEMKAVTAEFQDNADSMEALSAKSDVLNRSIAANDEKMKLLTAQYEKQTGKLRDLEAALEQASKEFGETSKEASQAQNAYNKQYAETQRLADQINKTRTAMGNLRSQLSQVESQMSGTENSTKDLADAADDLANGMEEAGDAADGAEGKFSAATVAIGNLASSAIQAAVSAVGDLIGSFVNLDKSTEEYRRAQGRLNTAFEAAGYGADTAQQAYRDFYGILGDTDTATEASQLLAKLARSAEDMSIWTNIAAGVSGTFGDSLPIEGLIEASNETAKVGAVTGVLADALNWAGINEDVFNEQLAAAGSESERNQLIMETLAETYDEASDAFYRNNEALVLARENQAALDESMGRLGDTIAGIKNQLLSEMLPTITTLIDSFNSLLNGDMTLGDFAGQVAGVAGQLMSGLVSGIQTALPMVGEAALGIIGYLSETLAANLPTIIQNGLEAVSAFSASLRENVGLVVDGAVELAKSLAQGLADSIPTIVKNVPEIVSNIANTINDNAPKIFQAAVEIIATLVKGLLDSIPTIIANLPKIISAIVDTILAFNWVNLGGNIIKGIGNGIKSLAGFLKQITQETFSGALELIKSLPTQALTWGKDLITNFVRGITGSIGKVVNAVKNIAATVADFIGFSEPDKGPLSDFHTYAPDMMKLYSQGIRDNLWRVTDAMDSAAERMQRSVPGPQIEIPAGTVSAGGGLSAQPGLYRIEIPVYINGKELYRATLGDLLSAINTSSRATGRGQLAY